MDGANVPPPVAPADGAPQPPPLAPANNAPPPAPVEGQVNDDPGQPQAAHQEQPAGDVADDAPPPENMGNAAVIGELPVENGPVGGVDWESFSRALLNHRTPLPEYNGLDHENPEHFLLECDEYFRQCNTPGTQRTRTAQMGLRGEAAKWWQCYSTMAVDWNRFQDLLRSRFGSQTIRSSLISRLYGARRGDKEPAGTFLQQKYMLFQRVQPDMPEANRVSTLVELLRPALRKVIHSQAVRDFAELLTVALEAKRDDEEERAAIGKSRAKETTTERPYPKGEKAPVRQLPKCWHCPDYHYHRDCEIFKNKQTEQRGPENWRAAGSTSADSAQNNQNL